MISRLYVGQYLRLPSGRVVVLTQRRGSEWVCWYFERVRGEVEFSANWLRAHCTVC